MLAPCMQQYLLKQEWSLHYGNLAQTSSIGPFHISSESVFRQLVSSFMKYAGQ